MTIVHCKYASILVHGWTGAHELNSVNEIFNPDKVDEIYDLPLNIRSAAIRSDRDTNYGVVRIELLESLYEHIYMQRLRDPDENNWQHNIIPLTEVASLQPTSRNKLRAHLKNVRTGVETEVDFDVVIVATGYNRSIPQSLLQNTKDLLVKDSTGSECWNIGRDYKLQYGEGKVASNAGIWLQGCCESTHGVSNYPEFKSCPAY